MIGWTRFVIRHRKKLIAVWVVALVLGAAAASHLGDLLSNRFSVPGSDAEQGLTLLKRHFHERGDGAFSLVATPKGGAAADRRFRSQLEAAAQRAARVVRGAKAGPVQPAGRKAAFVQITTPLENQDAAKKTPAMRRALGKVPGVRTYLSGFPAINHDTQPIYNKDLAKGETIAIPIALAVLAFMF